MRELIREKTRIACDRGDNVKQEIVDHNRKPMNCRSMDRHRGHSKVTEDTFSKDARLFRANSLNHCYQLPRNIRNKWSRDCKRTARRGNIMRPTKNQLIVIESKVQNIQTLNVIYTVGAVYSSRFSCRKLPCKPRELNYRPNSATRIRCSTSVSNRRPAK